MFLNRLSDKQKELFLDICIHAANADNHFADEEKEIIDQYCNEMLLPGRRYETDTNLNDVIDKIVEISSDIELKLITFELLGLMLSDKKYDDFEQLIINNFISSAGITQEDYSLMLSCLEDLMNVYKKIGDILFG